MQMPIHYVRAFPPATVALMAWIFGWTLLTATPAFAQSATAVIANSGGLAHDRAVSIGSAPIPGPMPADSDDSVIAQAPGVPAAPGAAPSANLTPEPAASATPSATPLKVHRPRPSSTSNAPIEVEPASARVLLKQNSWAYSHPAKSSTRIQPVTAGKYINVTGSTRYYLRVALKSGQQAYVPISAVELTRPTDKVFSLTADAPVRDAPNQWGRKVSAVHKGHSVHVIGIALNYLKIRMKNGLEGYIPVTALK